MHFELKRDEIGHGKSRNGKYYSVRIRTIFCENELSIIHEQNITHKTLVDRLPSDGWATEDIGMNALKVRSLLNSHWDICVFNSLEKANTYEEEVRIAMTRLKIFLTTGGIPHALGIKGLIIRFYNRWSFEFASSKAVLKLLY